MCGVGRRHLARGESAGKLLHLLNNDLPHEDLEGWQTLVLQGLVAAPPQQ